MDKEVKPCPFCGAVSVGVHEGDIFCWRYAMCNGCGARAPDVRIQTLGSGTRNMWEQEAYNEALTAWNQRYELDKSGSGRLAVTSPCSSSKEVQEDD